MFMVNVPERMRQIEQRISKACARSGRDRQAVKLIVVTKSATMDQIKEMLRLGYTELGESRAQQLRQVVGDVKTFLTEHKEEGFPLEVNWHMIGHLQRNKVRQVLPSLSLIHSVDTLRLAEEIDKAARALHLRPRILLQVNVSGEAQKFGIPIGAATHLAEQFVTFEHLRLCGLMVMGPLTENEGDIRSCFARARELFVEIKGEKLGGPDFSELSMGMSNDYEIAVEEGSTLLRIGSAIFA
jgi:PLP dependent protein